MNLIRALRSLNVRREPVQIVGASDAGMIEVYPTEDGGAVIAASRGRMLLDSIIMRPNQVHALIIRGPSGIYGAPGSLLDLGTSHNLRTTAGLDWESHLLGGQLGSLAGSPATASSATALTSTGTTLTASALVGKRVYADNGTAAPVSGNIGANTTSVITVDSWVNADDTLGTTPAATAAYGVASGMGPARYIGLTTDTVAPAAGDTVLTSEITTGGLARALGTYAHTGAATSYTLSKTFSATAAFTAVHKAGLFTASTLAAAGILAFESVLNADATLASGDSLALTWTVNI